jgi:hypothetical protein
MKKQQETNEPHLIKATEALKLMSVETRGISVTLPTLIAWAKKNDFGRRIGHRWFIKKEAFIRFLQEEDKNK